MYTNIDDATNMNDVWIEVQKILREFREKVLPLSLKYWGGHLRGGGFMVMRIVSSR